LAMHLAGYRGRIAKIPEGPDLTLFEQKYRLSGHDLWAFTGNAAK
jgi:tRNA (guanine-N7-)-methyltransferase